MAFLPSWAGEGGEVMPTPIAVFLCTNACPRCKSTRGIKRRNVLERNERVTLVMCKNCEAVLAQGVA